MLRLMRLELRKLKWFSYLRNAIITIILLSLWCVSNINDEFTTTYTQAFSSINSYVRATFLVFSSVIMSRMIIDEYRNRTICILFMYPVSRKKQFLAKLTLLSLLTFSGILIANIVAASFFLMQDAKHHYLADVLTNQILLTEAAKIVLIAIASTALSLIPLFFGMLKKSVPATILSSVLIAVGYSSGIVLTLSQTAMWTGIAIGLGLIMTYLAIRNIEHADVTY